MAGSEVGDGRAWELHAVGGRWPSEVGSRFGGVGWAVSHKVSKSWRSVQAGREGKWTSACRDGTRTLTLFNYWGGVDWRPRERRYNESGDDGEAVYPEELHAVCVKCGGVEGMFSGWREG